MLKQRKTQKLRGIFLSHHCFKYPGTASTEATASPPGGSRSFEHWSGQLAVCALGFSATDVLYEREPCRHQAASATRSSGSRARVPRVLYTHMAFAASLLLHYSSCASRAQSVPGTAARGAAAAHSRMGVSPWVTWQVAAETFCQQESWYSSAGRKMRPCHPKGASGADVIPLAKLHKMGQVLITLTTLNLVSQLTQGCNDNSSSGDISTGRGGSVGLWTRQRAGTQGTWTVVLFLPRTCHMQDVASHFPSRPVETAGSLQPGSLLCGMSLQHPELQGIDPCWEGAHVVPYNNSQ